MPDTPAAAAPLTEPAQRPSPLRVAMRTVLGFVLLFAGLGHLTTRREEFRAQVPAWVPVGEDLVVVVSGVVEIVLGLALIALLLPSLGRHRVVVGVVVAVFFVAIFPGNVGQWLEGKDGFGLDTGAERFVRLLFQPLLVAWALWSTGAWGPLGERLRGR
jgi:uncharacterized membrane protein